MIEFAFENIPLGFLCISQRTLDSLSKLFVVKTKGTELTTVVGQPS